MAVQSNVHVKDPSVAAKFLAAGKGAEVDTGTAGACVPCLSYVGVFPSRVVLVWHAECWVTGNESSESILGLQCFFIITTKSLIVGLATIAWSLCTGCPFLGARQFHSVHTITTASGRMPPMLNDHKTHTNPRRIRMMT
jgi:hypothetical protein